MSNNSNNDMLFWLALVALFFAAMSAGVAKITGLDIPTSMLVVLGHICFAVWVGVMLYLAKSLSIRWILFVPFSIVLYLVTWMPALDYWAGHEFERMVYRGSESAIWYATGWVQASIALSIMLIGHGLIYFLSSDKDHWLFD